MNGFCYRCGAILTDTSLHTCGPFTGMTTIQGWNFTNRPACAFFNCQYFATVMETWLTVAGTTCQRGWCGEHAPAAIVNKEDHDESTTEATPDRTSTDADTGANTDT